MSKKQADVQVSFEETMRARSIFMKYCESDGITKAATLRTILADIGQTPSQDELEVVMDVFGGKVKFEEFIKYLSFLKREFLKPPPADEDTINAYVAIGGSRDRSGFIDATTLKTTVNNFRLTIDIDSMIEEVDEDGSGQIEYGEFAQMWEDGEEEVTSPVNKKPSVVVAEETPTDEERLATLRTFLKLDKSKEDAFARSQSMMKRKQSRGKSLAGSHSTRLPSIAVRQMMAGFGDTVLDEEAAEDDAPKDEKKDERLPPVNTDPVYLRYLGTKPATLGVKKGVLKSHEHAAPSTARSARDRSASPPRSARAPVSARR